MKRKAIFLLYRILQGIASPAIIIYLLLRQLRNRRYLRTLPERLGALPASWQKTAPGAIWLHAVSAGEVLGTVPLIREIRKRSPGTPIYLSTGTLAGRETAYRRLAEGVDGIFYAPFDFVWTVRRVLRRLRPTLLVIVETEIWPNLFREAKRVGCGLMLVNGRISDRALPRYRLLKPLFAPVLGLCDRILSQSDEMRNRFVLAGAPVERVIAAGNLKYDFEPAAIPADSPVLRFIAAGNGRPLWIAASTSADDAQEEEDSVIAAQHQLAGWRLILAPRKPERFDAVARKLTGSGLRWTRRSAAIEAAADVLLLDSLGELSGLFGHADVVFMGGTLAAKGGHNVLEPAFFGKPVIAGPHLENFRDIEAHFEAERALLRIASGDRLADAVVRASQDPDLGQRALAAAETERGATTRSADAVLALYRSHYPCERPAQPSWMMLWLLSHIWLAGGRYDRRRKRARQKRLPVPVVSVGNITAGGTGKTPVTIELLRDFHTARPGLLTRGHGRHTSDIVLLPTGKEQLPIALTGDEAQLYVRSAHVPIGIGPERYEAGKRLLGAASVKVLFLDDGFQHLQLHRDFDLVLIDALRPFGGGHLLPLGMLREPLNALARANAVLITHANEAVNVEAIEAEVRKFNPRVEIFRAATAPRSWCSQAGETKELSAMSGVPAMAFCGLGNPQSFWKSLDRLNVRTIERHDYGDHHRYTPNEIRRLAQHSRDMGARVLLTTAKDSVNLCPEYAALIEPLQLYWLEIGVEIERREELIALISKNI